MNDIGREDQDQDAGVERFSALMDQVRAGSQDAAEQVWRIYGPSVLTVVRRRLGRRLRSHLDSQDFVQDVWASFFSDLPEASEIETPDSLKRFLVAIARNKVIEEHRRQHGRRRDLRRQVERGPEEQDVQWADKRSPTPSQEALAEDLVDHVTSGQPPLCGRVVQLRREGLTALEIARREQTSMRTIRRVLARLKKMFEGQDPGTRERPA